MNNFKALCMMSQRGVKSAMEKYLTDHKYETINENGFLYAKGTEPVLLLAHMDTVHKERCKDFVEKDGKISSPQGIGGDDRCGIYIIMQIVKELHCSVLLCEDEEKGRIGAEKFANATHEVDDGAGNIIKSKYIDHLDVNYMIEFDRKGNNDAVFYGCDNPEFTKFITSTTRYKFAHGSYSDISTVGPKSKIAAVNLSCGYYNAHSTSEYVVFDEMLNTIEVAKKLIATKSEKFEYIEKKYTYPSYYSRGSMMTHKAPAYDYGSHYGRGHDYYDDYEYGHTYPQMSFDDYRKAEKRPEPAYDTDLELCLEVVYEDFNGEEQIEVEYGDTKAELWAKIFLNNPDLCFNMITDYNFS